MENVAKLRTYSYNELRKVAYLAAGAGSGAVMRLAPDVVMPTENIIFAVEEILSLARWGELQLLEEKANQNEK